MNTATAQITSPSISGIWIIMDNQEGFELSRLWHQTQGKSDSVLSRFEFSEIEPDLLATLGNIPADPNGLHHGKTCADLLAVDSIIPLQEENILFWDNSTIFKLHPAGVDFTSPQEVIAYVKTLSPMIPQMVILNGVVYHSENGEISQVFWN